MSKTPFSFQWEILYFLLGLSCLSQYDKGQELEKSPPKYLRVLIMTIIIISYIKFWKIILTVNQQALIEGDNM